MIIFKILLECRRRSVASHHPFLFSVMHVHWDYMWANLSLEFLFDFHLSFHLIHFVYHVQCTIHKQQQVKRVGPHLIDLLIMNFTRPKLLSLPSYPKQQPPLLPLSFYFHFSSLTSPQAKLVKFLNE